MLEHLAVPGATKVQYEHSMYQRNNALRGARQPGELPGNQQERLHIASWLVGFVDGEGCFSISVIRNATTKLGYQIFAEFVVTQGKKSLAALERMQRFFGCGHIYVNRRYDNHREPIYRYCVRSLSELRDIIVPFFLQYSLQTEKRRDFLIFRRVVAMMNRKIHLQPQGRVKILKLASQMNRKQRRRGESSETIREGSPLSP